jgi:hypothetical protein
VEHLGRQRPGKEVNTQAGISGITKALTDILGAAEADSEYYGNRISTVLGGISGAASQTVNITATACQ